MNDLPAELLIDLDPPIVWNQKSIDVIELREPTAAQVIKALSDAGSGLDANHKMVMSLVCSVSGKPRQVIEQMGIRQFNVAGEYVVGFIEGGPRTSSS